MSDDPQPRPTAPAWVTRFAPSPTGELHLGHAYSARWAWRRAQHTGGRFIVRIEDIDQTRCKPEFEAHILNDLRWLGLAWDGDVLRQSDHFASYAEALAQLDAQGLIYPCFCTRKEILAEVERIGDAPHGPLGLVYPGTCRDLDDATRRARRASEAYALRLDMAAACARVGPLSWHDQRRGHVVATPARAGDVVLARKDTPTSYHLSVTVDDHRQGVTLVTRGEDLFEATHIHCLLQALLGFATPRYEHHPLLRDASGRRFAKRDRDLTLRHLRTSGHSPEDVWAMVDAMRPEGGDGLLDPTQ